ncbi:MAG: hypothetical protein ACO4CS_14635 [bacterium]
MKVTVSDKPKKARNNSFTSVELWEYTKPKGNRMVILRTGTASGVVLYQEGDQTVKQFGINHDFSIMTNVHAWKRFEGTLEISND